MQGRNPSTAIPDPDQKRKQRLRMLRNCTIVVLVVVLIVLAVNLVRYFTRSRSIGVYSLPCFAHQDVTVFRDGVVYYDGNPSTASVQRARCSGRIRSGRARRSACRTST